MMDTITDRLAKATAAAHAVIARAGYLGITVTGLSLSLRSFALPGEDDVDVYFHGDDAMRLAEDAGAEAGPWYGDAQRQQRDLVWTVGGVRVAVYEVTP